MHFTASVGDQVLKAAVYNDGAVVAQHFPSKHIVSVWLEVHSDVHKQRCYCRTVVSLTEWPNGIKLHLIQLTMPAYQRFRPRLPI